MNFICDCSIRVGIPTQVLQNVGYIYLSLTLLICLIIFKIITISSNFIVFTDTLATELLHVVVFLNEIPKVMHNHMKVWRYFVGLVSI